MAKPPRPTTRAERETLLKKNRLSERDDIMSRLPEVPSALVSGYSLPKDAPALEGSEKQIKWAEKIRAEAFREMTQYALNYSSEGGLSSMWKVLVKGKEAMFQNVMETKELFGKYGQQHMERNIAAFNDTANRINRVIELVESHPQASFWIDNRKESAKNVHFYRFKAKVDNKDYKDSREYKIMGGR
jgi:hypothetical protein